MSDKPKRRWYQFGFSIRDMLWLITLVGLGLAWWVDRRGIQQLQQDRDIWKYHAEGAKWLSNTHPPFTNIEINGKEMTGKHPEGGTFTRTWPEDAWRYDNRPPAVPIRPNKPKPFNSQAPASDPPK